MAEVFRADVTITDDMTQTQELEAIRALSKAAQTLGAIAMLKGRHSISVQSMQLLLGGATMLENAAANWLGPSPLTVPQLQMVQQRPA
jgi:hypothetical protein